VLLLGGGSYRRCWRQLLRCCCCSLTPAWCDSCSRLLLLLLLLLLLATTAGLLLLATTAGLLLLDPTAGLLLLATTAGLLLLPATARPPNRRARHPIRHCSGRRTRSPSPLTPPLLRPLPVRRRARRSCLRVLVPPELVRIQQLQLHGGGDCPVPPRLTWRDVPPLGGDPDARAAQQLAGDELRGCIVVKRELHLCGRCRRWRGLGGALGSSPELHSNTATSSTPQRSHNAAPMRPTLTMQALGSSRLCTTPIHAQGSTLLAFDTSTNSPTK